MSRCQVNTWLRKVILNLLCYRTLAKWNNCSAKFHEPTIKHVYNLYILIRLGKCQIPTISKRRFLFYLYKSGENENILEQEWKKKLDKIKPKLFICFFHFVFRCAATKIGSNIFFFILALYTGGTKRNIFWTKLGRSVHIICTYVH